MKVILSKFIGFCCGVRRAVDLADSMLHDRTRTVFADGEIVHNRYVMDRLYRRGLKIFQCEDRDQISHNDVILTCAHGTTRERKEALSKIFSHVVDGTCPHVSHMLSVAKKHASNGGSVVIAGDRHHQEVLSLVDNIANNGCRVIETVDEISGLNDKNKILFMAQSTLEGSIFDKLASEMSRRFHDITIYNSICTSARNRQCCMADLRDSGAQAVIVIGGHNSNNTKSMVKIANSLNLAAFHVESKEELQQYNLSGFSTVGVASGTSTSDIEIDEIVDYLNSIQ